MGVESILQEELRRRDSAPAESADWQKVLGEELQRRQSPPEETGPPALDVSPLARPPEPVSPITDPAGPMELDITPKLPEIVKKAADAGVVSDKAAPAGHFLASLAYDDENRRLAYERSIRNQLGRDIPVRIGPETGVLEYLDEDTGRYALVTPPGATLEGLQTLGGPAMVVGTEMAMGALVAIAAKSPTKVVAASAMGAFAGEILRLSLGRDLGINENITEEQMIESALKEGGISAAGGVGAAALTRIGQAVIRIVQGRVIPSETLKALGPELETAQELADAINARIGAERLKFSLGQASGDEDIMAIEDMLRRSPEWRAVFGAWEKEQSAALREFNKVINSGYQSRLTGEQVQGRVREVAQGALDRSTRRADQGVSLAEAELDRAVTSLKDRPYEDLGPLLREVGDSEQQAFTDWAREGARALDDLAGGAPFIKNSNLQTVVRDIDATVRRALFPRLQQPQRGLVGPEFTDEELGILNRLYDPQARFTFAETWEAISALKRAQRISSKGLSTEEPAPAAYGRLARALEKDLRESSQANPLREQYDQFIRRYAQEKARLDEGTVGKLMERSGGRNANFQIADENVFRTSIITGGRRGAEEVHALIRNDPQAMQAMRESLVNFYKRTVGIADEGRVNLRKHEQFMRDRGKQMELFFTKDEMRLLRRPGNAERVLQAREEARKRALGAINKTFEAELADINSPGKLLSLVLDPKNPAKARELVGILRREKAPDVLRGVQAEARKVIADRVMGQFAHGERQLNHAKLEDFLFGKGGEGGHSLVLKELFGEQYVKDLTQLNNALRLASKETRFPNTSATSLWNRTLNGLARWYVGIFTMAGRGLTAFNRVRQGAANRVLVRTILNPDDLRDLIKLANTDIQSRRAAAFFGSVGASALSQDTE
jgi:hypothetical protein